MTNTEDYLKSIEPKPNPYERDGKWYWYDYEQEVEQGPYSSKFAALVELEEFVRNLVNE